MSKSRSTTPLEVSGERKDEYLAALVAGGNRDAFAALYDRFADLVFALALHMLGTDTAEEATQDVFLRLWQKGFRFDPTRGAFRPWFLSVARHQFLDRLRRRSLEQRLRAAEGIDILLGRIESPGPGLEELASRQERAKVLHHALAEIPDEQRRVIVLAYFAGMSESEMARLLSTPLGTVKKRVRLGMQKLRSRLDGLSLFDEEARPRPNGGGG